MNRHDDILDQLSAYLDGELPPDDARRVENAALHDASLAKELARLRAVRNLVRALPRERAGEEFVSRVMARVERAHLVHEPTAGPEVRIMQWGRHLATAAMVLIALGIGGIIAVTVWKTPSIGRTKPPVSIARLKDSEKKGGLDRDALSKDLKKAVQVDGGSGHDDAEGRKPQPPKDNQPVTALAYHIDTADMAMAKQSIEGLIQKSGAVKRDEMALAFDVKELADRDVQYRVRLAPQEALQFQRKLDELSDTLRADKPGNLAERKEQDRLEEKAKEAMLKDALAIADRLAKDKEQANHGLAAPGAPPGAHAPMTPAPTAVLPATAPSAAARATAPAEKEQAGTFVCKLAREDAKDLPDYGGGKSRGSSPAGGHQPLAGGQGSGVGAATADAEHAADKGKGDGARAEGGGATTLRATEKPAAAPSGMPAKSGDEARKTEDVQKKFDVDASGPPIEFVITLRLAPADAAAMRESASKAILEKDAR